MRGAMTRVYTSIIMLTNLNTLEVSHIVTHATKQKHIYIHLCIHTPLFKSQVHEKTKIFSAACAFERVTRTASNITICGSTTWPNSLKDPSAFWCFKSQFIVFCSTALSTYISERASWNTRSTKAVSLEQRIILHY